MLGGVFRLCYFQCKGLAMFTKKQAEIIDVLEKAGDSYLNGNILEVPPFGEVRRRVEELVKDGLIDGPAGDYAPMTDSGIEGGTMSKDQAKRLSAIRSIAEKAAILIAVSGSPAARKSGGKKAGPLF